MMKTIWFLTTILLATACVSVKLSGTDNTAKRAVGVAYNEPAKPFTSNANPDVDASWKNTKNGNMISFVSDCKDPSDPPLDNIVAGVVAGITDLKYESREEVTMQGREGRRVLATGKVDGVQSAIDLLVFKRNFCIYILTYAGVKTSFPENREDFNRFTQGFRAP